MSSNEVRILGGNNKLGSIPNLSLLPVVTCAKDAPCTCKNGCYAKKFLYPNVKKAWGQNTEMAKNPKSFFASLDRQFAKKTVKWFRFFVSGDIPSYSFLCNMMKFTAKHPGTKFLLFTKRYKWVNRWLRKHTRPSNCTIIFSSWTDYPMDNPHGLPVAWMRDGIEDRIPTNVMECPGNCENCGMCWSLPILGVDVVFDKH
jgi:hypothetical protein